MNYYVEKPTDIYEEYSTLVGPDDFKCTLTEPEDREWFRDLNDVIVRLNEQHDAIDALRKRVKELEEESVS